MKFQNIAGWILLIAGISIILWSLFSSYNIFTGRVKPPVIFATETKEMPLAKKKTTDFQTQLQEALTEQLGKLFPSQILPQLLNLISWSIFAGILIFGGTQIASLGIKLIKK